MLGLLGFLLVAWIVLVLIGLFAKGLFWLAVIGAVLFVLTAAYGYIKREALSSNRH